MHFFSDKYDLKFFILLILFALTTSKSDAQVYGLNFSGNEVSKDLRTGLDLTHYRSMQFKDEWALIFDLKLGLMAENEFGYIFRITSNENNIDLIYNKQSGKNEIVLVSGRKFSNISYNVDLNKKTNVWVRIELKVDLKSNELSLSIGESIFHTKEIGFKSSDQFSINFGAVLLGQYATTHVPPMSIRGIQLFEGQKLTSDWPLDEAKGEIATDKMDQNKAFITNPSWLIKKHFAWENVQKQTITGKVAVVFDEVDDNLMIISDAQLWKYSIRDKSITQQHYNGGKPILTEPGNALYLSDNKEIITFNKTDKSISSYKTAKGFWENELEKNAAGDFALHYNKFFLKSDNQLFVLGGYASNSYKNNVDICDLSSRKWQEIKPTGDFFGPRFLAALGLNQTNDTAYILGGYGSDSGNSILNPHYYYDLFSFAIKDKSFHKIHKYSSAEASFTFANSMVINNKENCFYALRFSLEKFADELQLVKGSFSDPKLVEMASAIPFNFQEKRSYADLFYSQISQQLVTITVFYHENSNESEINIFTLNSPPNISNEIIHQEKQKGKALYWIIFVIFFDLCIFLAYIVRKRLIKKKIDQLDETAADESKLVDINYIRKINAIEKHEKKSFISLFGGFQVFDCEGNDITRMFTPLLKELFLIIVFYTYKNGNGIQSAKLTEMLWFGKSAENAINNRSVNLGKLRNILNLIGDCELSNKTGYWAIDFEQKNSPIYFDFWEYKYLINQRTLGKEEIRLLISILNKGELLPFSTYSWLDNFKDEVTGKIIDKLLNFLSLTENAKDHDLIIELANAILIFDPMNEDAMILKCKALMSIGKHGLAKSSYDKFANEYLVLYLIPFDKSFKQITDK